MQNKKITSLHYTNFRNMSSGSQISLTMKSTNTAGSFTLTVTCLGLKLSTFLYFLQIENDKLKDFPKEQVTNIKALL
jgi:hypothetical protein